MTTKLDTTKMLATLAEHYDLSEESVSALSNLSEGEDVPALTDVDGDHLHINWRAVADAAWDDECGETIAQYGGLFVHDSSATTTVTIWQHDCIRAFLSEWHYDSYGSREGLFAAFGLDPELDEAAEDHDGECRIWVTHHYYAGTCNAPADGWVTDEDDEGYPIDTQPRIFASYADAAAWIEDAEEGARAYRSETDPRGCYVLSHGEASPPDYAICKA